MMFLHKIVIGSGAFLLFLIQPMIAKYILPFFGGGASVWNVSLLFFMTALLVGYVYAYGIVMRCALHHRALHGLVVLFVTGIVIIEMLTGTGIAPIMPHVDPHGAHPVGAILWFLCVSIGLPYVLLATTSILVQHWAAESHHDPYQLYGASNLGSFGAIMLYPFVFELAVPLSVQGWWWSVGFLIYVVLLGALMIVTSRTRVERAPASGSQCASAEDDAQVLRGTPSWFMRSLWVAIAALSSMILLSTTLVATQGISAGPFSWLVPLGLYLLSYTIAFRTWRMTTFQFAVRYMIFFCAVLFVVILALLAMLLTWVPMIVLTPFVVTVTALMIILPFFFIYIHRVLYELRPSVAHLPAYYVWIVAGGAFGGITVNIIAPLIAAIYIEVWISVFGVVLLIGLYEGLRWVRQDHQNVAMAAYVPHLVVGSVMFLVVSVAGASMVENYHKGAIMQERNFYGALSVREQQEDVHRIRTLVNGRIIHGSEVWQSDRLSAPTTYYVSTSGIGRILTHSEDPQRVAVLGLGAGEIATYCRTGDDYTFYEIDPAVTEIARSYFTYLAQCPDAHVVHGDARLTFADRDEAGPVQYDVVAVDVFTDDAIPVHLVTQEAFDLYAARLAEGGVIAVHISNSFLDLLPVMQSAADHLTKKLVIIDNTDLVTEEQTQEKRYIPQTASLWALLVDPLDDRFDAYHSPRDITSLPRPWTDEYSSLFHIIQWR